MNVLRRAWRVLADTPTSKAADAWTRLHTALKMGQSELVTVNMSDTVIREEAAPGEPAARGARRTECSFVNELGNHILVDSRLDGSEVTMVISGPASVCENTVTIMEALEVHRQLGYLLATQIRLARHPAVPRRGGVVKLLKLWRARREVDVDEHGLQIVQSDAEVLKRARPDRPPGW
ncbi:hypothetical protein OG884_18680 [Streptosporangium sp. NBC_01755]|uniref:hypothetical protein n=1 Tax=unclassified Streptosporangium TaxID=2632669 RepID=UPI002DDBA948|nr:MULTISPECIES: hypothetical protein [unclassified Streptosporangium]WSA23706.1 hypothetical protein OIE13_22455 [Streptosporangium sp. NBC_01810]WSD03834.1 hypothetical protein OG884_18680 [Streptosporangium sp. NBC_01755]